MYFIDFIREIIVMGHNESLVISNDELALEDLVRVLLVLVMAVMAALTVLTHISQICSISFSVHAVIGVCVAIIVAGLVLYSELSKQLLRTITYQPGTTAMLLSLVLFGGVLCLVSHRYAYDDAAYVPNVIYYLENTDDAMGFNIHFFDSGRKDEPFISYHRCSIAFEYSQGIVAYITRVHFLTVYYLFAPALFGCMVPLAFFYLISRFSFPSKAAITGSFFICLSLLLMGEHHASFGNNAFNRIYEGKTVMFVVGFPLFAAMTMDFFQSPCAKKWLYLSLTAITMIGLSTSAAVLIPMLALALAISCSFSYVSNMKSRLIRSFCYFCSLFYPVLYAGSMLLVSLGQLGSDKAINQGWPKTFWGQADRVLNGPVVIGFLVLGTIVAVIYTQKRNRRFLVIWIISLLVCYLNPFVSGFVVKYVTTPNIYWRVFYLLPFPLVIGLSAAGLELSLEKKSQKLRYLIVGGLIVALLAAHLPKSSSSVFRRRLPNPSFSPFWDCSKVTKLGLPGYKVDPIHLDQARKVMAMSPPAGAMLAIPSVSITLPMLTSIYPQISTRRDAVLMWMEECGRKDEGIHRLRASGFLEGQMEKNGIESLVLTIQQNPQIRSIVATRRVAESDNKYLFGLLKKLGFGKHKLTDELVVFIRSDSCWQS